ncbi:MAG: hypothetical protein EOO71_23425 [Myxococcaceae bacterium]|nr:MAG: hypothetical protein EOO71_23425 [Myxococcaceae bacterium]
MTVCKSQSERTPHRREAEKDLPDKPPPGPAGVQATPQVNGARGPERKPESDLPDKPPPGPAGLDPV